MKQEKRESGIEIVGDIAWGTHISLFYQTNADLIEILVPYFKAGLENNECCIWVTSGPVGVEDARKALYQAVNNLDSFFEKGQIEILDSSQWQPQSGKSEFDDLLQGWLGNEAQGLESGFDGLRINNTFRLEEGYWDASAAYEAWLDGFIQQHRILAICAFALDKCGASEIIKIVSKHERALIRRKGLWELIHNSVGASAISQHHPKQVLVDQEREQRLAKLQNLTQSLILAQELERKQISQALHDDMGQALTAMSFNLAAIEKGLHPAEAAEVKQHLSDTQTLIEQTLRHTRDLTQNLYPTMLDDLGLLPALRWYTDQYAKKTDIVIQLEAYDFEARLPPEIETGLFWVVVEALTNAARHAKAGSVSLMLERSELGVRAKINDDGVGFDLEALEKLPPHERGMGLLGIQERMNFIGGSVLIKQRP